MELARDHGVDLWQSELSVYAGKLNKRSKGDAKKSLQKKEKKEAKERERVHREKREKALGEFREMLLKWNNREKIIPINPKEPPTLYMEKLYFLSRFVKNYLKRPHFESASRDEIVLFIVLQLDKSFCEALTFKMLQTKKWSLPETGKLLHEIKEGERGEGFWSKTEERKVDRQKMRQLGFVGDGPSKDEEFPGQHAQILKYWLFEKGFAHQRSKGDDFYSEYGIFPTDDRVAKTTRMDTAYPDLHWVTGVEAAGSTQNYSYWKPEGFRHLSRSKWSGNL